MFHRSFAVEGGDTTGKTTITSMIENFLFRKNISFVKSDYYNNEFGFAAMKLGLQPTQKGKDFKVKLIMHSVEWNIENIILPAMHRNKLVIYDRCFLSTMVYQCAMEGTDPISLFREYDTLFDSYGIPLPHVMLIDIPIDTVMERLHSKLVKDDSYEEQDKNFHNGILENYRTFVRSFTDYSIIQNDPFLSQEELDVVLLKYFG